VLTNRTLGLHTLLTAVFLSFFIAAPLQAQQPPDLLLPLAANVLPGDLSGYSVATDGTTLVVGAPKATGGSTAGVYGVPGLGEVRLYQKVVGVWTQVATLTASNGASRDSFGLSVAVDGNVVVVGAEGASVRRGSVYLFVKPNGGWVNKNEDLILAPTTSLSSNAFFGHAVDIEGDTVVVGMWDGGANANSGACVYEKPATGWPSATVQTESALLQPLLLDVTGTSVPPNSFGISVAVDGSTVVVGGSLNQRLGKVYLFEKPPLGWRDSNADGVLDGNDSGVIRTVTAELSASSVLISDLLPKLGFAVDIQDDVVVAGANEYDVAGAMDAGAAFVFVKPTGGWVSATEDALLTAPTPSSQEGVARSVAIWGDQIMLGSYRNPNFGFTPVLPPAAEVPWPDAVTGLIAKGRSATEGAGSVYLFTKPAGGWAAVAAHTTWQAPVAQLNNFFGYSVALNRSTYVAGAWGVDLDLAPLDAVPELDVGEIKVKQTSTVDLSITKTDGLTGLGSPPLNIGDAITYTLSVTNNDLLDSATQVIVEDWLAEGFTLVSAIPSQGSCDLTVLPNLRCHLGMIAASPATASVIVNVTTNAKANAAASASGIALSNTVKVSSDETDDLLANNSATDGDTVINASPVIDLGATLTVVNESTTGVSLDASATVDLDGTVVGYVWSQTSGEAVSLLNATTSVAQFDAPALLTATANSLVFQVLVTDNNGGTSTLFHSVTLLDITPPVLALLGTTPLTHEAATMYSDAGATASDSLDGDISNKIVVVGLPDVLIPAMYTISYDVTDAAGNSAAQISRLVTVADTTPPVISLNSGSALTFDVGSTYVEAATASDTLDGDLTLSMVVGGSVNTAAVGNYPLTYDAVDAAGNNAIQVGRTVTVADISAPVITLNGGDVTLEVGSVYTDQGATAVDNLDLNPVVTVDNQVNNGLLGVYSVIYSSTDAAGNSASVTRKVTVVDTTVPVITRLGNATITTEAGLAYADAGATASDNYDGDISADIVVDNPVKTSSLSSYTVTYDVSDASFNSAVQVSRSVTVTDTTPPVIQLNSSANLDVDIGSTYVEAATVLDSFEGNITANLVVTGTVNTAAPAVFTLTYNAVDGSGNVASSVTRQVTIIDIGAPIISITGGVQLTIGLGSVYSDAGATAVDNVDPTVTVSVLSNNVDTSVAGRYSVIYQASDVAGNVAQVTRTVIVNALPLVNGVPTASVVAGVTYRYQLDASDVEGDALVYTANNFPSWLSLSVEGELVGRPTSEDVGSYEGMTITISDAFGSVTTGVFAIEVTAVLGSSGGGAKRGGGGSLPFGFLLILSLLVLRQRH